MKNIPCQLPDPVEFPEKPYMHFRGKAAIPLVIIMASWFLAFAHYLAGIDQLWTLAILGFCLIYGIIPTKWYMQNVYRFFIGSFIGTLYISLLLYYIGWLFFFESGIYSSKILLMIVAIIVYFIIFSIELYQSLSKVSECKKMINLSILKTHNEGVFFQLEAGLID